MACIAASAWVMMLNEPDVHTQSHSIAHIIILHVPLDAGDADGGKQPGSRSQKLELGKGLTDSTKSDEPAATILSKLLNGNARFTRRIISLGKQTEQVNTKRLTRTCSSSYIALTLLLLHSALLQSCYKIVRGSCSIVQ